MRSVSSVGSIGVSSQPITINTTIMITFSRLSDQSSLPLISRMLINSVSEGLNGVQVECVAAPKEATTTVHIIGGRLPWLVNLHSTLPQFPMTMLTLLIHLISSNSDTHDLIFRHTRCRTEYSITPRTIYKQQRHGYFGVDSFKFTKLLSAATTECQC